MHVLVDGTRFVNLFLRQLLRVFDLSGFVARNLSGCHIAQGGRYEADKSATGDTEDEIRGNL